MGKADLHIHTRHGDGVATVPEVLAYVEASTDLDVIGITEHDTFRAADEARQLHARGRFRFDLVCGIEVTTLDGHLLAVFIDGPVESFRRIEETLEQVHRMGGLAIVPHPFSWLTRSVTPSAFERVAGSGRKGVHFDAIEEYSSSLAGRATGGKGRLLNRERYHLAAVGGSDAHHLRVIGTSYTRFDGHTAAELRSAIEDRRTEGANDRIPSLAEIGYRNALMQLYRGWTCTPRNAGWLRTIRSFVTSRLPRR